MVIDANCWLKSINSFLPMAVLGFWSVALSREFTTSCICLSSSSASSREPASIVPFINLPADVSALYLNVAILCSF